MFFSKKPAIPFLITDKGEGSLVLQFAVHVILAFGVAVWAVLTILKSV